MQFQRHANLCTDLMLNLATQCRGQWDFKVTMAIFFKFISAQVHRRCQLPWAAGCCALMKRKGHKNRWGWDAQGSPLSPPQATPFDSTALRKVCLMQLEPYGTLLQGLRRMHLNIPDKSVQSFHRLWLGRWDCDHHSRMSWPVWSGVKRREGGCHASGSWT